MNFIRAKLLEIAERLNTPRFAIAGTVVAFVSLAIIGLQKKFDAWAPLHLDGIAWLAVGVYDGAVIVSLWCVWPAIITAMFGRSPAVPKEPPK